MHALCKDYSTCTNIDHKPTYSVNIQRCCITNIRSHFCYFFRFSNSCWSSCHCWEPFTPNTGEAVWVCPSSTLYCKWSACENTVLPSRWVAAHSATGVAETIPHRQQAPVGKGLGKVWRVWRSYKVGSIRLAVIISYYYSHCYCGYWCEHVATTDKSKLIV